MTEERIQSGGRSNFLTQTESFNQKAGHSYIYVIGATGTAIIDPSNWELIAIASGITPGETGFLVDNHYRDKSGRIWSVFSATEQLFPWQAPATGGISVWDAKSFRNEKII